MGVLGLRGGEMGDEMNDWRDCGFGGGYKSAF
jgi:hypothetical protein